MIDRGMRVAIRNPAGETYRGWALTGPVPGRRRRDALMVWVTTPDVGWDEGLRPGDEGTLPWPADAVTEDAAP